MAGIERRRGSSPNLTAVYQTIFSVNGRQAVDQAAATYLIPQGATLTASATNFAAGATWIPIFYFDDADYAVPDKTLNLRLRAQVAVNDTAAAINLTFGLYPVTSTTCAADQIEFTLGTVVASSTAAVNAPGALAISTAVSSAFTAPADGPYTIGVVTSGQLANNSQTVVQAQLQAVWV